MFHKTKFCQSLLWYLLRDKSYWHLTGVDVLVFCLLMVGLLGRWGTRICILEMKHLSSKVGGMWVMGHWSHKTCWPCLRACSALGYEVHGHKEVLVNSGGAVQLPHEHLVLQSLIKGCLGTGWGVLLELMVVWVFIEGKLAPEDREAN